MKNAFTQLFEDKSLAQTHEMFLVYFRIHYSMLGRTFSHTYLMVWLQNENISLFKFSSDLITASRRKRVYAVMYKIQYEIFKLFCYAIPFIFHENEVSFSRSIDLQKRVIDWHSNANFTFETFQYL